MVIRQLHSEAKLQSIEQRCEYQILKLLYGYSTIAANVKTPTRQTRAGNKIVFKIPSRCSDKYLNSPLYKGSKLWDKLDVTVQCSDTIDVFMKGVKPRYVIYQDLLAM